NATTASTTDSPAAASDSAAAKVAVLEREANETLAQRKARLRRQAKAENHPEANAAAAGTPTDGDATSEGRA
ncbi:MAG: hypothetical protein SPF30_05710, partial [Arcanobacterium sp.]|nr:hypothetical protein [Arcanobacterium sp.]